MIARIVAWFAALFGPTLETLLLKAREHGNVSVQSTMLDEGAGWTCYIRPDKTADKRERWAVSAWGGQGVTLREAIISAIEEAGEERAAHYADDDERCQPKLGGKGYEKP